MRAEMNTHLDMNITFLGGSTEGPNYLILITELCNIHRPKYSQQLYATFIYFNYLCLKHVKLQFSRNIRKEEKNRRGKDRENKNIHHAYNMLSLEEDHSHTAGLILETYLSRFFVWLLKPVADPRP